MSNWKKTTLGDLISIKGGFSYKGENIGSGSTLLLGMGCVSFSETFLNSGARQYSGETPDSFLVEPGEIVLATRQQSDNLPILGAPAIIPSGLKDKRVIVGTNLYKVVNESKIKNDYLFWLLRSPNYRNHIDSCAKGSTVKMITKDAVESFEFMCPEKNERESIADFLWQIEKKIDLLKAQNKNLEATSSILFKQWFVDEPKEESSNYLVLDDLIESMSITHKFPEKHVVFLNTSDIFMGNVIEHSTTDVKSLPGQAKKTIQKDDILFSEIRPANGRWAYIDFDAYNYVVSTKLMVLRSKGKVGQAFIYFYLTNNEIVNWLQLLAESRSGTFPQITFDQLKDLKIYFPSEKILSDTIEWCEGALKKIKFNQSQIKTLTSLSNTLLPKLLSGEISIM